MKKIRTISLVLLGLLATSSFAITNQWVGFVQTIETNRQLTVALYPGYAPDLDVGGKESVWGGGMAVLYPVGSQYTLVGARLDWLAETFYMPSVNLTLKADVQLFGHNFTPFVMGGAIMPLAGAGNDNTEVGSTIGAGIYTTVWNGKVGAKDASLQVFGSAERWSNLAVTVYRPGVAFTLKW
jgi:hypothetical protein